MQCRLLFRFSISIFLKRLTKLSREDSQTQRPSLPSTKRANNFSKIKTADWSVQLPSKSHPSARISILNFLTIMEDTLIRSRWKIRRKVSFQKKMKKLLTLQLLLCAWTKRRAWKATIVIKLLRENPNLFDRLKWFV